MAIMIDKRVGFAFDLHGTLIPSNEAWIKAYELTVGSDAVRNQVTRMVYQKMSRRQIASILGVPYDVVLENYHRQVTPDRNMCRLVCLLSHFSSVFLVSSASQERVERDLRTIELDHCFTAVYHGENFCKANLRDWERLISNYDLDLLYYIGNDIKEDMISSERICVLLSGTFMKNLDELGMLYNRDSEKNI